MINGNRCLSREITRLCLDVDKNMYEIGEWRPFVSLFGIETPNQHHQLIDTFIRYEFNLQKVL